MGVTLYADFYPKECRNPKIIPYLTLDGPYIYEMNGKYLPQDFYKLCYEYSEWDDNSQCWIFDDSTKLFEFAGKSDVPDGFSVYITNRYSEDTPVFILWKR